LTIGIDFTASNGLPTRKGTLHYVGETTLNSYEQAIRTCGDTVAYYDYDKLFPVFGYGANPPGQNFVSQCFPLTGTDDPNVYTIDGVLKLYREQVPKLYFNRPTHFSPLMRGFNKMVKEEKQNNKYLYHILMILTDGQIYDMKETINELVIASFEPISVIIIGIGTGPFGNMDILDADDNPLISSNGVKAARDLVQFVPFSKFPNNGIKLAEQVLEEVPQQICEYYKMNNLIPGDPID
jgi:hypothetical protein